MCTLAIYFQASDELPLVIAANRDELLHRVAYPPARLAQDPWVVGGRDAVAGGTWLGVNAHHLVAGLLNRRSQSGIDPNKRSRGLLCLDALRASTTAEAATAALDLDGADYNPFHLLLATPADARVIGNFTGRMRQTVLPAGLHLLSNLELNDPRCPRIAKSVRLFEALTPLLTQARLPDLIQGLREILSDHSTELDPRSDGIPNNLCVHRDGYGTRSAMVLVYERRSRNMRLWFADGPPCRSALAEIALPHPT